MKKIAWTLALTTCYLTAHAGTPNGPYTAFPLKITALVSVSAGAFVYFDGSHQCGATRAYISGSRADFSRIYATLLAAQASDALLSVDLRDTSANGSCNGDVSSIANLCVGAAGGPCFTAW